MRGCWGAFSWNPFSHARACFWHAAVLLGHCVDSTVLGGRGREERQKRDRDRERGRERERRILVLLERHEIDRGGGRN